MCARGRLICTVDLLLVDLLGNFSVGIHSIIVYTVHALV